MSAFFVGTDHINALLSWLDTCCDVSVPMPQGGHAEVRYQPKRLTEIGKALIAENIASLRARYPDDWQQLVDVDVNDYEYEHDAYFVTRHNAVVVLKMLDCYEYQSCEHEGWKASWAANFCAFVRSCAARRVPGYENAPGWEYTKPADAPNMVRLTDLIRG